MTNHIPDSNLPDSVDELIAEFGSIKPTVTEPTAAYFKPLTPIWRNSQPAPPFPTDMMPPQIRSAIEAVAKIAAAHHNTAAWAVIGSASAAAQTIARVESPAGPETLIPVSLFTHHIAASGTRKSTCFNIAWKGILDADAKLQNEHAQRKAALTAQQKGKGSRPVTTDQELCRSAGTIKQVITDTTIEALARDANNGNPYPVLASAEGAAWYLGYSAASDPNRAVQTSSTLSSAHSGEHINVTRIGADGKAPNRTLNAGDYAIGMHFAVQDLNMGYNLLLGPASEHGMSSRVLLSETPQPPVSLLKRLPDDEQEKANAVMNDWRDHIYAIRMQTDSSILTSEHGATPRAVILLSPDSRQAIAKTMSHFIASENITEEADRIVFDRLPEQICRIAATLLVAETNPLNPGQRYELQHEFVKPAAAIALYHWKMRQRITEAAMGSELNETCESVQDTAMRWLSNGAPKSIGKNGYNPEDGTFSWGCLIANAKHVRRKGKHGSNIEYKLAVKERMLECGIIGITPDGRIVLNPECWEHLD